MPNLNTSYLGLSLKNPLIASSSSLSSSVEGIRRLAQGGVGAIVLKSLFEEQIAAQTDQLADRYDHAEAYDYLQQSGMNQGGSQYLELIQQAKSAVDIPIIASVNCVSATWWNQYAKQIEISGADALEVNFSLMPQRFGQQAGELEEQMIQTIEEVCASTTLPVAVKIGPYFTSLPALSLRLKAAGASALTLFNRFYQYDFDLISGAAKGRVTLSDPDDYHTCMRWTAILFERCGTQLSASTGIHSGEAALKLIAAGADTVQLCSVFYRTNTNASSGILGEMEHLMETMGLESLDQLRGRNSQKDSTRPEELERLQYIKALTGVS